MKRRRVAGSIALAWFGSACGGASPPPAEPPPKIAPAQDLRPPEDFASIADRAERSRALFLEASKVMLHPRCANCHPQDDSPRQRDGAEMHDPPVTRGPLDRGVPALECGTCHQDASVELARIPGAPGWHLAPKVMAWLGRTPAQICEQVKDPSRNGQRTLAAIVEHAAHDKLVAWGWSPGHERTPAPGSQARFGALVQSWVDTGAECPREVTR
jgi:hypothetical protein